MKQKQKRAKKANTMKKLKNFAAERAARGQANEHPAAEQLGATEQDVQPLTPPAATPAKQAPVPRKRYAQEEDAIFDPADELTPG